MENDRYENHLRKLRQELYANSIHFAHSIMDYFPENTKIVTPQGGFMLWVELDKQIDTTELYYRAMQRKISIAPRTYVYITRAIYQLYAFKLWTTMDSTS